MKIEFRDFLMKILNRGKNENYKGNSLVRHSYLTTHLINVDSPLIVSKPLLNRNLQALVLRVQTVVSGMVTENVSYSLKTTGGYISIRDFLSLFEKETDRSAPIDITAIELDINDTLLIYANKYVK